MAEWTIDELAREAGTTVRNIRVYQDRGLLDPPRRQGRLGLYSQDHLDRLCLILRLLERGYPMAAIRELLEAWRGQKGLGAILGFDEAVHRAFVDEESRHLTIQEMQELFPGDDGSGLAKALQVGMIQRDGDGFVTRSPGLLQAGAQLVADGMPIGDALEIGVAIWGSTDQLARWMVQSFVRFIWEPFRQSGMPEGDWPRILQALENSRNSAMTGVMSALGDALRRTTEETIAEMGEPLELARDRLQTRPSAS